MKPKCLACRAYRLNGNAFCWRLSYREHIRFWTENCGQVFVPSWQRRHVLHSADDNALCEPKRAFVAKVSKPYQKSSRLFGQSSEPTQRKRLDHRFGSGKFVSIASFGFRGSEPAIKRPLRPMKAQRVAKDFFKEGQNIQMRPSNWQWAIIILVVLVVLIAGCQTTGQVPPVQILAIRPLLQIAELNAAGKGCHSGLTEGLLSPNENSKQNHTNRETLLDSRNSRPHP